MKKSKIIFTFSALGCSVLGVMGAALNSNGFASLTKGGDLEHGLVVNSANMIALDSEYGTKSGTVKTNEGNDIGLYVTLGKSFVSGIATINELGTISNTTAISGIESIVVNFEGSLSLYGGANQDTVEEICALESDVEVVLSKTVDYFLLLASEETNISSIDISHSCSSRFVKDETQRFEAETSFGNRTGYDYSPFMFENGAASGGKYVKNFENGHAWYIEAYVPFAGERNLNFAYQAGTVGHKLNVSLDGVNTEFVVANATGWDTFPFAVDGISLNLTKGWHSIEITFVQENWFQLDYFELTGTGKAYDPNEKTALRTSYFCEAEFGNQVKDAATPDNQGPNYSYWGAGYSGLIGMGFRDYKFNGVEFTIENMAAGNYTLTVGAGCPNGSYLLSVNGKANRQISVTATETWDKVGEFTCQVTFTEGTNTLRFARNGVWFNMDYFKLTHI